MIGCHQQWIWCLTRESSLLLQHGSRSDYGATELGHPIGSSASERCTIPTDSGLGRTTEHLWQNGKLDFNFVAVTNVKLVCLPGSLDVDIEDELAVLVDRKRVGWNDLSKNGDDQFPHEAGAPLGEV